MPSKDDVYDYRHPLYIGDWKKSIACIDDDFANDDLDGPHMKRKMTILNYYPEIKKLYGHDSRTAFITIIVTMIQLAVSYVFSSLLTDWHWTMFVVSFFIGGTTTQICIVIIHEVSHGLAARTTFQNRLVGLIANISIPLPIAMPFRRYHLEHHTFQGVKGMDPDLPLDWEKDIISGSTSLKFMWLTLFPIINLIRSLAMLKSPQLWEYINYLFTISIDFLIFHYFGGRGLLYLVLSLWFGYSIHPAAARFIQEHYTFDDGQETYSYYGCLNKIFMNIGYHNEHHDFTKIAWSRLPEIRKIASEYYDDLAYHTSWFMVHWNFVTKRQFGPQSRVSRSFKDHQKGRKMIKTLKKLMEE
ncbi:14491_t:CDS:2 [Acaulospora morrowiae]|uniref:14491_t:CDS:1 n=1 Tax=Acaulospora morrowiae TaxID=94023 RepID=A0A9N9D3U0_9GLOM|nr:14491_t:CDS:2 [Acaulospora morrowiae]